MLIGTAYIRGNVPASVSPGDLRLPADMLILYYLYTSGQGSPSNIAETISRNDDYVAHRVRTLLDRDLLERVHSPAGPVTLTDQGVAFVEQYADDHILPDQREKIEAATSYSVTWR